MAEILVSDIVNGSLAVDGNNNYEWQGTGIFDVLMSAVNKNLESQYKNQRINGADYATVYASSIVAVMQQSIDFIMRKKLVEAQIDNTEANTDNIEADTATKLENQKLLYTQRTKVDKETALLGLDEVVKSCNLTPQAVYIPKYTE